MVLNSSQLVDYGFVTWRSFSLIQENALLTVLPKQMGVYVIRDSKNFGRYKGESDIVYIGSTISSRGLKRRIRFYFHPGQTQHTSQRIHNLLRRIHTLEISWICYQSGVDARNLEKKLLNQYHSDHHELPPFNRQGVRLALPPKISS